jgi:hypothetical protein
MPILADALEDAGCFFCHFLGRFGSPNRITD